MFFLFLFYARRRQPRGEILSTVEYTIPARKRCQRAEILYFTDEHSRPSTEVPTGSLSPRDLRKIIFSPLFPLTFPLFHVKMKGR